MTEGLSLGFVFTRCRWPWERGPRTFSRMNPPLKTMGFRASMSEIALARASGVLCFGGNVESWPICINIIQEINCYMSMCVVDMNRIRCVTF